MSLTIQSAERSNAGPIGTEPGKTRSTRRFMAGVSGLAVAVALVGLGSVLRSNASFAEQNVARQMAEQRITFKPAETLTPDERDTPCLVRYAGRALTTGAQAECYANHFIGNHLKKVADGRTYSEMRAVQTELRERLTRAQAANDPGVGDLQRELAEITGKRQTLFEGETVRGLLLTSYGFGTLGSKADQGATVAFAASAVVLLLSLLVLVWARIRS
ncbi:MAG: hypothetical protein AVDCRST_MAG10-2580 [uncultured Acidimicrobiales bacterium]|uniref:Uncharacterized protein n=1 Tax=uncultured Acidimicrobiales bacterium TaxID=310071 RepID=A0A6J4ISI9_9ACTN|nr:MAG: hypothetical protein AVDCRST_MAG10-2580 [uncultured Acidimicrobiales bacterium]